MSHTHYKFVIIGAGEIARAVITELREKDTLVISRKTDSFVREFGILGLNWTAGIDRLPDNITGDVVVNCIMPKSKKVAFAAISLAQKITGSVGIYVHLSTIALKSYPRYYPRFIRFIGDGYIRIKRAELNLLQKKIPSARVCFPGIVVGGETNWDKFFLKITSSKNIFVGVSLDALAPLIKLNDLASQIVATIESGIDGEEVLMPCPNKKTLPTWNEIICQNSKCQTKTDYLFFPSRIKNILTIILTSSLIPDFVWGILVRFNSSGKRSRSKDSSEDILISGMTNYYIGCEYTSRDGECDD